MCSLSLSHTSLFLRYLEWVVRVIKAYMKKGTREAAERAFCQIGRAHV